VRVFSAKRGFPLVGTQALLPFQTYCCIGYLAVLDIYI
jgi:hypothetical protein